MAMRSQVYEWDATRSGHGGSAVSGTNTLATARPYSIFIGGVGNNITKPAETTATQFVVIEDIGCTATDLFTGTNVTNWIDGPRAYIQVRINTTDYFLDPDNIGNDGIPGTAAPYPRTISNQPSFNLYPDVYVLPGQTWDALYTHYEGATDAGTHQAFVKYTLYDGPDALIANKLLEMGISVNPGNVDWYKRTLISGASATV
tara:strand:- start:19541 stop:20146 length:606 start_codon:yes stop_codon:yes gene_type:complete